MSDPVDRRGTPEASGPTDGTGGSSPRPESSGRPAFDARGRTVWEWKTETGHYTREASTTRVQKLALPELTLEKTAIVEKPEIPEVLDAGSAARGCNPYDRGVLPKSKPVAQYSAGARPSPKRVAVAPNRPTSLLGRLRGWISGH